MNPHPEEGGVGVEVEEVGVTVGGQLPLLNHQGVAGGDVVGGEGLPGSKLHQLKELIIR